ncbi:cobyrinic acid a,c-diamide synthase [Clostridium sp. DSM 8431]|uniref:cobyrinate a,c-diamide synthase n=1 Tax=Clostridium sp. DSM 8431 TaxID=1761781 RepID=UPI0008E9575F|nr:cobyrinate a,c-diamide synthase [Clostridium sp. DSM 8431]SFU46644.1 cobyrinic acid a,c-diamide synthase [Clostridium sp. DSM 8431]
MTKSRVMIAAASSGSGKTTITCGILQCLINRKMKVSSFKCGPDYIDPMFHSKIIGADSKNLDSFFNDENTMKYLMKESMKNSDISVIEGVMGYYDGISLKGTKASSYEVASLTDTQTILVVNCKGMSLSILPMIKGFLEFKKDSKIKGVILNNMSKMIYKDVKELIEEELKIKVFGYLPKLKEGTIESRHLGLVTPSEIEDLKDKLNILAETMEETIDIDGIISLANEASEISCEEVKVPKVDSKVKVAVALDKAFCFYYADNLKLLERMNAEVVYFSPLEDKKLPKDVQGVILGGGYPELYAEKLSLNKSMLKSIKEAVNNNMPVLAECGGFMYLHDRLKAQDEKYYDMAGIISGECYNTHKLSRFGYIEICPLKNNYLIKEGESILGHEFHYYDSTNCGESFMARKTTRKREWKCIHVINNLIAGYPHMNYYSNINIPYRFLKKCEEYKGQ